MNGLYSCGAQGYAPRGAELKYALALAAAATIHKRNTTASDSSKCLSIDHEIIEAICVEAAGVS